MGRISREKCMFCGSTTPFGKGGPGGNRHLLVAVLRNETCALLCASENAMGCSGVDAVLGKMDCTARTHADAFMEDTTGPTVKLEQTQASTLNAYVGCQNTCISHADP
jgi:hypothetical protein